MFETILDHKIFLDLFGTVKFFLLKKVSRQEITTIHQSDSKDHHS